METQVYKAHTRNLSSSGSRIAFLVASYSIKSECRVNIFIIISILTGLYKVYEKIRCVGREHWT